MWQGTPEQRSVLVLEYVSFCMPGSGISMPHLLTFIFGLLVLAVPSPAGKHKCSELLLEL